MSPRMGTTFPSHTNRLRGVKSLVAFLLAVGGLWGAAVYFQRQQDPNEPVVKHQGPEGVTIEQKLDAQVPLDVQLRDEQGRAIRLDEMVDDKPVLLTLVYYRCPRLCNMTLAGQVRGMRELNLSAGEDFQAITVSFDPREGHELAAAAKRTALHRYDRKGAERGWHFLTGDEDQVRRLADAVGFRYRFNEITAQYDHGAAIIVLTPEGKVSRYLFGVDFPERDLRLALVESSQGRIGSVTDQFLLLCYHYDPLQGRYGLAVMNALRAAGVATVVGLAIGIAAMVRAERQTNQGGHKTADAHRAAGHFDARDAAAGTERDHLNGDETD